MSIKTNLAGRLRNTSLPMNHGLMPLFDAVVNSIHSIEEDSNDMSSGNIVVEIIRSSQLQLGLETPENRQEKIISFKITDTGVGFNDVNMEAFEMLDTEHKVDKGCRGVGRLLWLKAFEYVDIHSTYLDGNTLKRREFRFDAQSGVSDPNEKEVETGKRSTTVHLIGFDKKYRESVPKTLRTISNSLLEHCLWYFVRDGGSPTIIVKDGTDKVSLDDLYEEYMHASASNEEFEIQEQEFSITHIKFRASSTKLHMLSFCAANRLVKEEALTGKIIGLSGKIRDDSGEFVYSCYVSSPYLDKKVRPERTGFDIEENVEGLLSGREISFQDIRSSIFPRIKNYLSESLQENIEAGKSRLEKFVAQKAPRYRPILSRIPDEELVVDANISDKDLDLHLHKHLAKLERDILEKGHEIMNPTTGEKAEDYYSRVKAYLGNVSTIKKSDLAGYICRRKVIIDLFEKALEKDEKGGYVTENIIHELIMPMGKDSNNVPPEDCNLWLLDEKLVFHHYLASDKKISSMPISNGGNLTQPDILALNIYDQPLLVSENQTLPLASITVIEIKRPMRNDAQPGQETDPIEQALGYLNQVRNGQVTTAKGRLIPNSKDIPGYCYIVCDLTEKMIHLCKSHDLQETSDHMGYFGFHKQYGAYVEVISFDRLVDSAKKRHRAFFDKLGLPTS